MNFKILFLIILFNIDILYPGEWKFLEDPFGKTATWAQFIDCLDSNNCIAVYWYNRDRLADRMTIDGGKTWFTTINDTAPSWEQWLTRRWHNPTGVQFVDTNFIIITCWDGTYWITRDKGLNWEISQFDTMPIYASFYNEKYGVLMDWNYRYLTNDGGITWNNIHYTKIDSARHVYHNILAIDSSTVFTGHYPFLYKSFDWGKTWSTTPIPVTPNNMFFHNRNDGVIVKSQEDNPQNIKFYREIIYTTNDGGESWQLRLDTVNNFPSNPDGIRKVDFADKKNGVIIGPWYKMYRTNDAGLTWFQDTSYYNQKSGNGYLVDIAYPAKDIIYGVSYYGDIYKYEETATEVSDSFFEHQEFLSYIFPNPNEGKMNLYVESKLIGKFKLVVFDTQGNFVNVTDIEKTNFSQKIELDLKNLSNGKYHYVIYTGNNKIGFGKFSVLK